MSTIMEEARRGVTPLVRKIAEKERVSEEFVRNGIASGRIVAPCNPIHDPEAAGIGEGMSIKVNVNLGTSRDMVCMKTELEKLDVALKYGADAVMDLSTGGDIDAIRKEIISRCPVMVGTVPIYQIGLTAARKNAVVEMTEDDMFAGIEKQAKDGVDFMTVHCGITRQTVDWLSSSGRLMGMCPGPSTIACTPASLHLFTSLPSVMSSEICAASEASSMHPGLKPSPRDRVISYFLHSSSR